MATRKYEQTLRADAAERTRRQILDAVYVCLRAEPSTPLSLDKVARQAGVARSTIYVIFESRAGLFEAVNTDLLERGGFERVLEAVEHPDALEHLRRGVRAGVEVFASDPEVRRAIAAMARLDSDAVGGATRRSDERRVGGMLHLAGRLAEQHRLRSDVSVEEAADLLWVLTSFEIFDQLHTDRGLDVDQVSHLLISTAERTLCRLPE